jgi:hypothetical protein
MSGLFDSTDSSCNRSSLSKYRCVNSYLSPKQSLFAMPKMASLHCKNGTTNRAVSGSHRPDGGTVPTVSSPFLHSTRQIFTYSNTPRPHHNRRPGRNRPLGPSTRQIHLAKHLHQSPKIQHANGKAHRARLSPLLILRQLRPTAPPKHPKTPSPSNQCLPKRLLRRRRLVGPSLVTSPIPTTPPFLLSSLTTPPGSPSTT